MSNEQRQFLSLPRYPGLISLLEACWLLGFVEASGEDFGSERDFSACWKAKTATEGADVHFCLHSRVGRGSGLAQQSQRHLGFALGGSELSEK